MSRRAGATGRSDSNMRHRSVHTPGPKAPVWITVARGVMAIVLGLALALHHDRAPAALVNFMGVYWILSGTVHQSDQRRAPGHLSRQGPPALRWALYEAAQLSRRVGSPDHDYYEQAAARLGGNRACIAVARKLLKRSYHTLRELGDQGLQPA